MAKTLTRTSIAVTINGNDYSKHVMFPFKVSNLLDEQLDEASLTLIGIPEKNFKPLTDVIVTLTNGNKTQSYYMLVASDKSDEIPSGSGRYKHELYLIEQTKYLECFIVRSIGYLNPLQKEYAQAPLVPSITKTQSQGSPPSAPVKGTVIGPQYVNTDVVFPSWYELTGLNSGNDINYTYGNQGYIYNPITNEVLGATGTDRNQQITVNIKKSGTYILRYTIGYREEISGLIPVINSANYNVDYYVVFI